MNRVIAASIVAFILAALLLWQHQRWHLVKSCHKMGGVWDGPVSRCRLVPARLFIRPRYEHPVK